MLMNEYITKVGDVTYNLKFRNTTTIIIGDSGTGKTLLYNRLSDEAVFNQDMKCLNFKFNGNAYDTISKLKNKIIIIDNGDLLLGDKEREFIRKDKSNQYIIFCKNLKGLPIGWSRLARLKRDGNEIKLYYFMKPDINGE